MRSRWPALALVSLSLAPLFLWADDPRPKGNDAKPATAGAGKVERKTFQVPYRVTDTQHVMVRTKLNGKGPFNFIIDTGAPLLYVTVPVAKKVGLDVDKKGGDVVTLDRFEIEGGVTHTKIKCLAETPFQLKGMNALGMPGEELHGIIGYTLLANYKLELDFTRDKMTWTRLDFKPAAPKSLGLKKDDGDPTGLEQVGGMMEALAILMGRKKAPEPDVRGFLGVELAEKDDAVFVKAVLPRSPAKKAGLKAGDRISAVQGKDVSTSDDVLYRAARVTAGQPVRLKVERGSERKEITVTAGEGL
ncbi:MAG: PDZ domain-containing protein [Gemmataceae bacterium]|nr:PDZ domain-containing protein [Gemmataceae bacterium]